MLDEIRLAGVELDEAALAADLDAIVTEGGSSTAIPVLTGITDLSVPVLSTGIARAALTVPFVDGPEARVTLAAAQRTLRMAATSIAEQLAPDAAGPCLVRQDDTGPSVRTTPGRPSGRHRAGRQDDTGPAVRTTPGRDAEPT